MTKKQIVQSASVVTTLVTPEVVVASSVLKSTPAQESIKEMPRAIELVGSAYSVLSQASVLIRAGFVFDANYAPMMLPLTGQLVVQLTPGNPDPAAIEAANEAFNCALSREQFEKMDADKRAAAAAKQLAPDPTSACPSSG
jgi:hypothetical protein